MEGSTSRTVNRRLAEKLPMWAPPEPESSPARRRATKQEPGRWRGMSGRGMEASWVNTACVSPSPGCRATVTLDSICSGMVLLQAKAKTVCWANVCLVRTTAYSVSSSVSCTGALDLNSGP